MIAPEVRIHNAQVLDRTAVGTAEETDSVLCCVVEVQAGNGLVVALEGTGVILGVIADGGPFTAGSAIQGAILVQDVFVDHDVCGQNGVSTCFAAVDQRHKPVELACVADGVIACKFRRQLQGLTIFLR